MTRDMTSPARVLLVAGLLLALVANAGATRVKDIARLQGVRDNQLIGYGLVIGLSGTGDSQQVQFTNQSIAAMLSRMAVRVDPKQLRTKNVAAVLVTADLPPFASPGARIDVVVSSMGDAKSLNGGTLIMTPLQGPDGNTYAVAQGPLSVGGFSAAGGGSRVTKNHPTVGRIPNGALIEVPVGVNLSGLEKLVYVLNDADFTTANNVAQAITAAGATARALDSRQIEVDVPEAMRENPVELIAKIELATVETDSVARVVINARTGTVVMGSQVRLKPVALAHGGLQVEVMATNTVSQPQPFANGRTVGVQNAQVVAAEAPGSVHLVDGSASLGQLVQALNALGVTPRDLIDVLQTMKASGALEAELVIQ